MEVPGHRSFVYLEGVFVKLVRPLPERTPIVVRLTIDGKTIGTLADAQNCYEEIGMVIKFLDLSPEDRRELADFLGRHQQRDKPFSP